MYFGFPHLYLPETDSTNAQLINLLANSIPEQGFMVIADFQSEGRGQFGRQWVSAPGQNLLASYLLGPLELPVDRIFDLQLAASLAVFHSLDARETSGLSIKWPNDLYSGNEKIAGILLQNVLRGKQVHFCLAGVGVNVNQSEFPSGLRATSLFLRCGKRFELSGLAVEVRQQLLHWFAHLDDRETLLQQYNERLYGRDGWLQYVEPDGSPFSATVREVLGDGRLVLMEKNGNLRTFVHGTIQSLPL
jgi:BirA family biotin operon repressor/biotin-[acetyl-CoA-carboxylase] ligase